ncbi:MAG TPA: VWA domain-containing protein [Acidobacteriaceae bacterium]|nr:VWA domain-containing protein [Acidobacteriaceae bacterium]
MKRIRYTKYSGDLAGEMDLESLLDALSDYLLDSGFRSPLSRFQELEGEQTLDNLREALRQALEEGDFLDDAVRERMRQMASGGEMDKLLEQLMERLEQENYISVERPNNPSGISRIGGQIGQAQTTARFQVTDKGLDFLGYRTLRDLLGSLGKSSFGRHDTRAMDTGVETSGGSRRYEFGDTMNLDATATLSSAIAREGLSLPLNFEYADLHVHESEYQSSCATVVMLDCSHSMILYGEDRFTPAKRVAMALSHLVRTQYPGDTLSLVLFHDSAEELPLSQLARAQVGPYYTNTRAGLQLAQRILSRQRKDMKQIVMITDGKPSALTLPDGRIYKNAFGLDPLVVGETLQEVARCRRSAIMINTFMLASDPGLVQFVQRVSAMCQGKAYFTTPDRLGEYLLMDFLSRKMKTVH